MDWNYMRKLLRPILGALLALAGIVLMVYSFALGFEITLLFLSLLITLAGALIVFYGIHKLPKNE